ncbi:MAG: hypothetical protein FK730_06775 [Asgard group archaeon]|nr:hypothetical protein [Asgard group archaeon]
MISKTKRQTKHICLSFFLLLGLLLSNISFTSSLVNLVEETLYYKIYSGNYFNLIIPKFTGPEMNFEINDWGIVKLKFNYLSEYDSPTIYLNSLNYLSGKGYHFDNLEWDMYGLSESERAYVNLTRDKLDKKTIIEYSAVIFNSNVTIEDFSITALQTTYIEMRIHNWTFSEEANGFALNVLSYMEEEKNYLRLGPYNLIEEEQFAARVWYNQYSFEFRFPKLLTIITDTDEEEQVFVNSFETYNPAKEDNEPVDCWISIPNRADIKEIILRFVCNFETIVTQTSSFLSYGFTLASLFLIAIPITLIRKRSSYLD